MTKTTETPKQTDLMHQIDISFTIEAVTGQVSMMSTFVPSTTQDFDYILKTIKEAVGTNKEVGITGLTIKPIAQKGQKTYADGILKRRIL
jgi:hypothetical protein